MKISDAAKILQLNDKITPEIVKKAYRKASNKYHPDKGGSDEMMKAVNQAYSVLKEYEGIVEVSESDINYPEFLNEAINGVLNLNNRKIEIEICGAWVWLTGETKRHAKSKTAINKTTCQRLII